MHAHTVIIRQPPALWKQASFVHFQTAKTRVTTQPINFDKIFSVAFP